jgi:hypothetical protein
MEKRRRNEGNVVIVDIHKYNEEEVKEEVKVTCSPVSDIVCR